MKNDHILQNVSFIGICFNKILRKLFTIYWDTIIFTNIADKTLLRRNKSK